MLITHKPRFFVHHNGTSYPTANFMIWPVSHALHHDATLFPSPFSFRPERFLPENLDSIPKGAFRPFEYGPRNCIGQELALLEAKIVCVLTIRRFDIWAVYAEMDQMSGKGWRGGMGRKGKPDTVEGERAYQVLVATAKPAGGMPARVKRTERGEGG